MNKNILFLIAMLLSVNLVNAQEEDPYEWLEKVEDEKALEWVEDMNKKSLGVLTSHEKYDDIYQKSLEIYNSDERIAYPNVYGDFVYNFWQDADHVRGIWRRSSKENYMSGNPDWEILLDLDEMSKKDDVKWVYKGATGLYPDYKRFMVFLSRGGGDATIKKEFSVEDKSFVNNGFSLPEAKGSVNWIDENTLIVSTDFGKGTLTTSGYPRQVKIWERGTDISEAKTIFEGDSTDVGIWGMTINKADNTYTLIHQGMTFFTSSTYIFEDNEIIKLDIPEDADINDILNRQVIIHLKSEWRVDDNSYPQGALISADYNELLKGNHDIKLISAPTENSSITSASATKNMLIVNMLNNVKSELYTYIFENGNWKKEKVDAPEMGSIGIVDTDSRSDEYFFNFENFLLPSTLYFANASSSEISKVKSLPSFFDGSKYKVWQYETESKDGTMIPYFVVGPKNMNHNGRNPTLLNAYGGFEVSRDPFYLGTYGAGWLEQGGVYVLANIRGGGEFGPAWHQAGRKEKRQNVFDDFHSVAEDLISRNITSGEHLGIMGGSNGGLLVGVAFTQRPELYEAVVCLVPLLDMKRYNKLLAGASWMDEYGNPDIPEEWAYLSKYSPYHNVRKNVNYPEVFFSTSTRDDRVHPGHARKMVAKMTDMGHNVFYFENTEGGHGLASTNEQKAKSAALRYVYLLMKLKEKV
jgi:prolyl oligopeptidase